MVRFVLCFRPSAVYSSTNGTCTKRKAPSTQLKQAARGRHEHDFSTLPLSLPLKLFKDAVLTAYFTNTKRQDDSGAMKVRLVSSLQMGLDLGVPWYETVNSQGHRKERKTFFELSVQD